MSDESHPGKMDVHVRFGGTDPSLSPIPEVPFRILILGDFSGRKSRRLNRRGDHTAGWRPLLADRDNLEEVLAKLNVEIRLPLGVEIPEVVIPFSELDDFHPDRLFKQVDIFQALRDMRRRLENPATFADAAAEVRSWSQANPDPDAEPQPNADVETDPASSQNAMPQDAGILEQTLEQTDRRNQSLEERIAAGDVDWNQYIKDLVEPYTVEQTDPKQPELVASVDTATNALMRSILHHPDFQGVESGWRAVEFLTRRLETDQRLKIYLLDVSKHELADELASSEDLQSTELYKLLVDQSVGTAGAEPWTLFLGNYTFHATDDDVELMQRIAKVAQAAGAPFLAAASAETVGCESLHNTPDPDDWKPLDQDAETRWHALRHLPEASSLGLLLPRFLLRLPYGKKTDPIDQFAFEEMEEGSQHQRYLWGNPAFACVLLLGQAFSRDGWALLSGLETSIPGLAAHVYQEDGESQLKPCAEVLLTDRAVQTILEKGLMPLVSVKNQDTLCLPAFRSLSKSNPALAGRWC